MGSRLLYSPSYAYLLLDLHQAQGLFEKIVRDLVLAPVELGRELSDALCPRRRNLRPHVTQALLTPVALLGLRLSSLQNDSLCHCSCSLGCFDPGCGPLSDSGLCHATVVCQVPMLVKRVYAQSHVVNSTLFYSGLVC